jgi:hypothetical protein
VSKKENAIKQMKARFYRIPSNSYPQFYDTETYIKQGDPIILKSFCESLCTNSKVKFCKDELIDELDVVFGESFTPSGNKILNNKTLNLWTPPNIKPSGQIVSDVQIPPIP